MARAQHEVNEDARDPLHAEVARGEGILKLHIFHVIRLRVRVEISLLSLENKNVK